MSKEAKMRELITKNELSTHEVSLMPLVLLRLWRDACESLIVILECEKVLLDSVEVKAIVMDDIRMAEKNLATIKGGEALHKLGLGNLNLN